MLGAMAAATGLVVIFGYLFAWLLRIPAKAKGTFVQGAFRGNLAFIGLPIIYAMPDTPIAGGLSARSAAVVVVAPMMVGYNLVAVVALLLSQHEIGWGMVKPLSKQLLTTPPLLATLAGIGFAVAGWTLPTAIDKTFSALGEMALPLGLLGVGGSIVAVERRLTGVGPWGAALLKTALSPALGWAIGAIIGLDAVELKIVMIFMAAPTAIVSYAMALELHGDESIASGSIVLSVLMSIPALAIIIGVF
jgi:predicted permease